MKALFYFLLPLLVLFISCNSSNSVITSGHIQKRKYLKGFYVSSVPKKKDKTVNTVAKQTNPPLETEVSTLSLNNHLNKDKAKPLHAAINADLTTKSLRVGSVAFSNPLKTIATVHSLRFGSKKEMLRNYFKSSSSLTSIKRASYVKTGSSLSLIFGVLSVISLLFLPILAILFCVPAIILGIISLKGSCGGGMAMSLIGLALGVITLFIFAYVAFVIIAFF